MNEKTDLSKIKGNLNKAELKLLNMADPVAVSSAMKNTTPEDIIEMVNRVFAMEFDQENPKKTMSDQDKAIMLAEKLRRIRAKNKANPMGKKDGGVVKKFNEGGDAKTITTCSSIPTGSIDSCYSSTVGSHDCVVDTIEAHNKFSIVTRFRSMI